MPHVVIEGPLSAERAHRELQPFDFRSGGAVHKLRESFLARSGRVVLLEAIVVEGVTRRFLIELDERDQTLTVRLYPPTDPEKTDGVKRMVALVGDRLRALSPDARITRTNLAPFLAEIEPHD